MNHSDRDCRTADAMLKHFSVHDKFGNREMPQGAAKRLVGRDKAASDKNCPNCGNVRLVLLRTHNQKACCDCHTTFDWNLDPGQKPVGY